jgi:hypothetical protein
MFLKCFEFIFCSCFSALQVYEFWFVFQCIACNNFNSEDPAYNTLLAFVQHEDAVLSKIVHALKRMGRFDVINMTAGLMSGIVALTIVIAAWLTVN